MLPDSPDELHPHLLYRTDSGSAAFATWRLEGGPEALALFTTADAALKYQAELADPGSWTLYQPPRDRLVSIFDACLKADIRQAALDPLVGGARTLFDIGQIVAAAKRQAVG